MEARRWWVMVAAVCAAIFMFSQDAHSTQHSDAVLGLMLSTWGRFGAALVAKLSTPFCKFAHVVVYSCLGASTYLAFSHWGSRHGQAVSIKAWMFCVLFSISDEIHQSFIPSRDPSLHDVLLDSTAALLVILLMARLLRGRSGGDTPPLPEPGAGGAASEPA